jgi:hypothetical protein
VLGSTAAVREVLERSITISCGTASASPTGVPAG